MIVNLTHIWYFTNWCCARDAYWLTLRIFVQGSLTTLFSRSLVTRGQPPRHSPSDLAVPVPEVWDGDHDSFSNPVPGAGLKFQYAGSGTGTES